MRREIRTRYKWREKKERVINEAWNNNALKMTSKKKRVINDEWNNDALRMMREIRTSYKWRVE